MAVSAVKKEPAKPKQAEPAPAAAEAPPPPVRGKGRKLLYVGLALVVLSGAGGGAWWHMRQEAGSGTPKTEPAKPPVFAPLDMFTVNLQPEEVQQFAQVGLTLRLADETAIAQLKLRMPEVRDRILLMLSAKKASELISLEGKRKLSAEIQAAVNEILVPGAAKARPAAARPKDASPAAPSETAAQDEKDGAAQTPAEPAPEAGAEAEAAAAEPAPAPVLPVTGVLFTSFIIQ